MKYVGYLPDGDADRGLWMINFNVKLPTYATRLSVTTAQKTIVSNDASVFAYALDLVSGSKTFEHTAVEFKDAMNDGAETNLVTPIPVFTVSGVVPTDAVAPGIFKRIGKLVKTIKSHPNYTADIGKDLGIIGADPVSSFAPEKIQPVLKGKIVGTRKVEVKYTKGNLDGVILESKRGAETAFTILAQINKPTYTDDRPNLNPVLPETRQYRASGFINDVVVGVMSDIITITVNPA